MSISPDLLQAKQVLSSRLLKVGLQGHAVGLKYSIRVQDAVSASGHNVHAVGIGRKVVNGEVTNAESIRIYVTQKLSKSLLSSRTLLPDFIDGIPTDIIESPPAFFMLRKNAKKRIPVLSVPCTEQRRTRQRPLVAGTSSAHVNVTAGTISCFCRSTRQGDDPSQVFVMSNNHVFADVNQSNVGDDLYQPGPADGGTIDDHFAELHRFVEIKFGGTLPNKVDAAIGRLLPGIEYDPLICTIGKIKGTSQALEGMTVCKHGRTTGFTEGTVTDESVDALVGMDHNNPAVVALFQNQMRIDKIPPHTSIGLGGDSGSLVVDRSSSNAVGLYFAGPQNGSYGFANHISDVLSELQIELL